jgi:hypothetical protein
MGFGMYYDSDGSAERQVERNSLTLYASQWEQVAGKYRYVFEHDSIGEDSRLDIVPDASTLDVFREVDFEPYVYVSEGQAILWSRNVPYVDSMRFMAS